MALETRTEQEAVNLTSRTAAAWAELSKAVPSLLETALLRPTKRAVEGILGGVSAAYAKASPQLVSIHTEAFRITADARNRLAEAMRSDPEMLKQLGRLAERATQAAGSVVKSLEDGAHLATQTTSALLQSQLLLPAGLWGAGMIALAQSQHPHWARLRTGPSLHFLFSLGISVSVIRHRASLSSLPFSMSTLLTTLLAANLAVATTRARVAVEQELPFSLAEASHNPLDTSY